MNASTRSAWISGIAFVCLSAISAAQTVVSQTGVGNTLDSRQTLVLAKTATIVAQSGEVSQTGRWMMDPNPERAANALQKALEKWGRLKLVDEAGQADSTDDTACCKCDRRKNPSGYVKADRGED